MEGIENFKNEPEINPKKKSFLEGIVSKSKPYPIVDNQIKDIIKKYNLNIDSPNNITIPGQIIEKDSNFQKKKVIENQALRRFPGMSFYNKDRTLRLSDHWNTGHHDQVSDFTPQENYAYVGKKVDDGKWEIIDTVPLYKAPSLKKAAPNRHLEKARIKLLESLSKKINSCKAIAQNLYDLRLDKNIDSRLRGSLANKGVVSYSWAQYPEEIVSYVRSTEEDLFNYDTYTQQKIIEVFLDPIKKNLLTDDFLIDLKKLQAIEDESRRKRYKDKDHLNVSEYW